MITQTIPAKNFRTSRRTPGGVPVLIVLHTAENDLRPGGARAVAGWAASGGGDAQVSPHLCIDANETIRCVADEHTAFTQSAWNDLSLSIEHSGRAAYTAAEWAARGGNDMAERSAQAVAGWCDRWVIPCRRLTVAELVRVWRAWQAGQPLQNLGGITTHADLTAASRIVGTSGDHSDPGAGFPVDWIIQRANQLLTPEPPKEDEDLMILSRIRPFAGITQVAPGQWLTPELANAILDGRTGLVESAFHPQAVVSTLALAGVDGRALALRDGERLSDDQRAALAALGVLTQV